MQDQAWLDKVNPVKKLIPNLTFKGNWISGSLGAFKFNAKVYSEPSVFGIQLGHISKLQINNNNEPHWSLNYCYLHYDRGWDIHPTDKDAIEFTNKLLAAFGDNPLDDSDLTWWEVYGYRTEEDFDNLDRQFLFSIDVRGEALEEAQAYLDDDDEPYNIMKVMQAGDSDDIVVLRQKTLAVA